MQATTTYLRSQELRDNDITLVPSDDREYLLTLASANKYNMLNETGLRKSFDFIKHFWVGYRNDVKAGVIFICHIPSVDWYTLDAYKDDKLLKQIDNRGDFSYRAGKLVIDWFFQNDIARQLYTMHDISNRAATVVCKRLGFIDSGIINDFIVLKKEVSNG